MGGISSVYFVLVLDKKVNNSSPFIQACNICLALDMLDSCEESQYFNEQILLFASVAHLHRSR